MGKVKIFTEERFLQANKKGTVYMIFWAPGCPFSERARLVGLKLRKNGIKTELIRVGGKTGIENREKIEEASQELKNLLQTKSLIVTWPQVFHFNNKKNNATRLKGGYNDLINQKDVRNSI
tara:strand:- start:554 stop:916 length:363 start_codon:yes stop_codon:yes gene_type:complete